MPIVQFAAKDQVPEFLRDEAVEKDGKFEVDIVSGKKLAEFRDNNTTLVKERDDLKKVVDKVVPLFGKDKTADDFVKKVNDLVAMEQKVTDGKLKTSEDIEAEVARRTAAMKEGFENQLREKTGELATTQGALAKSELARKRNIVHRSITDAALHPESGVRTEALTDILTRAESVWTVNEKDAAIARDGEAPIYGEDGTTPITPKEWLAGLKKSAPHFFKGSTGGDANGGVNGSAQSKFGGYSPEEFSKLPATTKLAIANGHHKRGT